jgi:hypothetical protein
MTLSFCLFNNKLHLHRQSHLIFSGSQLKDLSFITLLLSPTKAAIAADTEEL